MSDFGVKILDLRFVISDPAAVESNHKSQM
jgi:hypothetical protein